MERYTMFLDWKNQYYENDYSTQSNLQIECNAYQITDGIFHRTRTKNFTLCKETQKTLNIQSSVEKEEWSWRNQPSKKTNFFLSVFFLSVSFFFNFILFLNFI